MSLKRGLYVPGLILLMPRVWHANKTLHLSVFTWRKILLGKYSSKSPVHQSTYRDVRSFVISPPLPKETIHSLCWVLPCVGSQGRMFVARGQVPFAKEHSWVEAPALTLLAGSGSVFLTVKVGKFTDMLRDRNTQPNKRAARDPLLGMKSRLSEKERGDTCH